jgi:hypothetical protein
VGPGIPVGASVVTIASVGLAVVGVAVGALLGLALLGTVVTGARVGVTAAIVDGLGELGFEDGEREG